MKAENQMLWVQSMNTIRHRTEGIIKAGFSPNILTRLRRDQYVSLDSIEKICFALDCKVDDILEFIPVDKENENG